MEQRHEIEAIIGEKMENNQLMYLVKWRGYSNRYNSYVYEDDLDADILLPEYLRKKSNNFFEEFEDENNINEKEEFIKKISSLLDWTQKCSHQMNLSPSYLPSASEKIAKEAEFCYIEELGQHLIQTLKTKEKRKLIELKEAKKALENELKRERFIFIKKKFFFYFILIRNLDYKPFLKRFLDT
ncbi:hypothetical protein ACQ4LE_000600 [Meloidogyne hapla]